MTTEPGFARRLALAAATLAFAGALASDLPAQDLYRRWFGDNQADRMGDSVARIGDVNGDGVEDVAAGISESDQNGSNCGAVRLFSGGDGAILWTDYGVAADDLLGTWVAAAGDVNGDGVLDVIGGAYQVSGNGYCRVWSGRDGTRLYRRNGDSHDDHLGNSVAGVGDVNGDGFADFAAGAPNDDNSAKDSGSVRVFSGFDGSALYTINGPAKNSNFGLSLAPLSDLDGDAVPDFIVGYVHQIDVRSGKTGGKIYTLVGDPNNADAFGASVARLGDVDADGLDDFIVGAPFGGGGAGDAYVYSGKAGTLLFQFAASGSNVELGFSVGGCGDVSGDGVPDIVVGSLPVNVLSFANVYSASSGRLLYTLLADDWVDEFGYAVDGAGDMNGDGLQDVLVGAKGAFDRQGQEGSVSVFTGNDLYLQAVPNVAYTGTNVSLQIRGGPAGGLAVIFVTSINGAPQFLPVAVLGLDSFGELSIGGSVPPGFIDVEIGIRAYACCPPGVHGPIVDSHDEMLSLR